MKVKVQKFSVAKESWDLARYQRNNAQMFAQAEQNILNMFAAHEMEMDIASGRLILALDNGGIETVKVNTQKAQEAMVRTPNDFYSFINSAVAGAGIPVRQPAPAKEELDSNSTQDEFVEAIAQAAADFISSNRNAFDLDDNQAVVEFADVFTVDAVRQRVVALLSQPAEETEETVEGTEDTAADDTASNNSDNDENPDMVSSDVMELLDK